VAFFAVTLETGPNWDYSRARRDQDAWDEHAAFMDGLVDDGFRLGQPAHRADGALACALCDLPDL